MNTRKRTLLITAGAMVLTGLLILAAAFAAIGFDFSRLSTAVPAPERVTETLLLAPGEDISLALGTTSVEIGLSPDEYAHFTYETTGSNACVLTRADGLVCLAEAGPDGGWTFSALFYLDFSPFYAVTVLLPAGFDGDLSVAATTGSVTVTGPLTCGTLDARVTTGSLRMDGILAARIFLRCTTGAATLDALEAEQIDAATATGSIRAKRLTAAQVSLRCSTGTVTLDALDAKHLAVTTTTGSIRGSVLGAQTDYTITAATRTGSCNLPAVQRAGERVMEIHSNTGAIAIRFAPQ